VTIQSFSGLMVPDYIALTMPPTSQPLVLDAAGEKTAFMVQVPKTGSIRRIGVQIDTVVTATDTDFRLETIDATTGNPTGTLFGTTTNGTVLAAAITTGGFPYATLTADASVTKGDKLAVVFVPTGTPNYSISGVPIDALQNWLFPYTKEFAAAAWGAPASAILPTVAIEYSDGTYAYIPSVFPGLASSAVFNSGSTPDERGLKFKFPASVRLSGAWLMVDDDGDYDLVLYDSDGTTVLASLSNDKDVSGATVTSTALYLFSSSITLLANTFYRLVVKPTSVTNLRTVWITVTSASILDQTAGGQNFHWTERTDAGSWTDDTVKKPFIGLILDGIDTGGGGPLIGGRLIS
jgi:hypothetical protein